MTYTQQAQLRARERVIMRLNRDNKKLAALIEACKRKLTMHNIPLNDEDVNWERYLPLEYKTQREYIEYLRTELATLERLNEELQNNFDLLAEDYRARYTHTM